MVGAGFAGRTDNLIVQCCETTKKDKQIVPGKSSGVRSFFAAALETHYTVVSVYFHSTFDLHCQEEIGITVYLMLSPPRSNQFDEEEDRGAKDAISSMFQ